MQIESSEHLRCFHSTQRIALLIREGQEGLQRLPGRRVQPPHFWQHLLQQLFVECVAPGHTEGRRSDHVLVDLVHHSEGEWGDAMERVPYAQKLRAVEHVTNVRGGEPL